MILFIILLVGLGFLGLVIKIAEGALRIFLILIVVIIIILCSIFGGGGNKAGGPATQLQLPQVSRDA